MRSTKTKTLQPFNRDTITVIYIIKGLLPDFVETWLEMEGGWHKVIISLVIRDVWLNEGNYPLRIIKLSYDILEWFLFLKLIRPKPTHFYLRNANIAPTLTVTTVKTDLYYQTVGWL